MSNHPPTPSQQATISEGSEPTGAQKTELGSRLRGSLRISWRWLYKHHEVLTVIASWAGVVAAISLVVWENRVARDTASDRTLCSFTNSGNRTECRNAEPGSLLHCSRIRCL